ncbi:hypothetical protein ACP70R_031499 [Stipagrostis hirtigluma subsp. patula]
MAAAAADGGGNDGGGGGNVAAGEGRKARNKKPLRVPAELSAVHVTAMQQQPGERKDKSPEGGGGSSGSTTATGSGSSADGQEQQQPRRRLVWTSELHEKFVRAYRTLGRDAVPKKILGLMDVEGLTRDNVASHLQKYRDNLRRRGQPVRRRTNGRIMHARVVPDARRAVPLQAIPPPQPQAPSTSASLHHQRALPPQRQGPFAAPNMSLPQLGHAHQLVQGLQAPAPPPPASRHRSHSRIVIHRHPNPPGGGPNFSVTRTVPMQHRFGHPSVVQLEAALQHKLFVERQTQQAAARMQQAAAASAYGHMPVMSYELGAQIRGAPAASAAQNHRPELPPPPPRMQACHDVDMSGESEAQRMGRELTTEAQRMAQLQIAVVEPEGGQQRAAEPAAAPVDPDHIHQDDLVDQYLISEPSWGYGFPPSKQP